MFCLFPLLQHVGCVVASTLSGLAIRCLRLIVKCSLGPALGDKMSTQARFCRTYLPLNLYVSDKTGSSKIKSALFQSLPKMLNSYHKV